MSDNSPVTVFRMNDSLNESTVSLQSQPVVQPQPISVPVRRRASAAVRAEMAKRLFTKPHPNTINLKKSTIDPSMSTEVQPPSSQEYPPRRSPRKSPSSVTYPPLPPQPEQSASTLDKPKQTTTSTVSQQSQKSPRSTATRYAA